MTYRRDDASLNLAVPGSRAGFWLFALTFVLPVLVTTLAVAVPVLAGGSLKLIAGSLPLTLIATLGGIALLCGLLWWVLARLMRRQALVLSPELLEVRSSFYRCRIPLRELKLDQARIVDLDEHTELRTMLKTNGFGLPGFHSGWFLLRNRRRSFVAIADGRRKLWLPGSGKHDLLLEATDPAALLARLRALAMSGGRG
ncbi:PH domain-containing protein [Pseudoxanthomonas daejeonensis]|uniref:PH domain-containing protein n=1 Tax=Pseudoxanthomonas daejeonensis TaxID=266062 RepID=UPI001F53E7E5|nr:PH domain-containing protein [Pseudoxanthomonas daejeonensis]UNK57852.1 PH domain-containing protein [Pseudoxanthomonas daejeonensis]